MNPSCLIRELDEEPSCNISSKVEENLSLYISGTHREMCVYFVENTSTKITFRPKTRYEVQVSSVSSPPFTEIPLALLLRFV